MLSDPLKSPAVERLKRAFTSTETKLLVLMATLIGAVTGMVAWLFSWLIRFITDVSLENVLGGSEFWTKVLIVSIPAIGGLLVGPLVTFWAKEAKGHGVPEVMLAVAKNRGKIRPRVALVKSIASAISIGSGGSAGKEGPIVQIGSALGSTAGQLMRWPGNLTTMLVACGAAGGISATFGTPIAGVLFAMEIILQQMAARAFSMVVISSVTASVVAKLLLGSKFFFHTPHYYLNSAWELFFYAALGVVAAIWARGFTAILYRFEDSFDAISIPNWIKPAIGGMMIGLLGLALPQVFGTGHGATEDALWGRIPWALLLMLSVGKILATSFTLGSGGSGGIFSPSLFIGAMLGGTLGTFFCYISPDVASFPGAYALVGMGAVFAAATRAPLTAIVIVFEMTNNYAIILPVMIAVVIATLASYALSDETIYTLKLSRRGIHLGPHIADALHTKYVSAIMSSRAETVPVGTPLRKLIDKFADSTHTGFPVVDKDGILLGIIEADAIQRTLGIPETAGHAVIAQDLMRACFDPAQPGDTLAEALYKMQSQDLDHLPVISSHEEPRLIGVVTRHDILSAYRKATSPKAGKKR